MSELNFIGIWKTRNGTVVEVNIKSTRKSGSNCFLGQKLLERGSSYYFTWNDKGNCLEQPELDLMERLSDFDNSKEKILAETKITTT